MIHHVVIRHYRKVAERGLLLKHRAVEPFGPVFKVAVRSVVEPRHRARLDDAPALKKLGPTHGDQPSEWILLARRAAKRWHVYMGRTVRHWRVQIHHHEHGTYT